MKTYTIACRACAQQGHEFRAAYREMPEHAAVYHGGYWDPYFEPLEIER